MIGPVFSSPVQSGQTQNSNFQQQSEAYKGSAQIDQRDPRSDEVQPRNAPAAQSQNTSSQSLRAAEEGFGNKEQGSVSFASNSSSDDTSASRNRGDLVDVVV